MRLSSLVWAIFCAGSLHGQADPQDILLHARQKILESVDRLPHYMCTETVERYRYTTNIHRHLSECDEPAQRDRKLTLQLQDRLRVDVAMYPTREMYAWHGAQQFDDRDLLEIVNEGALSTGEFGAHIGNLFGSNIADFTYNGDHTDEKGRTLCEFGYSVARDKSNYEFDAGKNAAVMGYDGTVLIDPTTFEVVRIVIETERLPADSGACSAKTVLDLESVPINGFGLLLPASARVDIDMMNGNLNGNRVSWSSCHEFHAESDVRFDDPEPATGPAAKPEPGAAPVAPLDFEPGLPFSLKLAENVDTSAAAAGDPVRLILAAPIRTRRSKVVPAGTVVNGRIMRVQRNYGEKPQVRVAIRLETIEVAGEVWPFAGQSELLVQRFNAGFSADRRRAGVSSESGSTSFTQRSELGSLDAMEARDTGQLVAINPGDHYVFRAGTEMKWLAVRPRNTTTQK